VGCRFLDTITEIKLNYAHERSFASVKLVNAKKGFLTPCLLNAGAHFEKKTVALNRTTRTESRFFYSIFKGVRKKKLFL
jgi:hypothetical protein